MDGDTYEQWVAGIDVDTGREEGPGPRGRERVAVRRGHGQRAEDLVAGRRAASGDLGGAGRGAGQGGRRRSSAGSPQHATTRVGPRGRQVQVPVEQIEAAVIRHYTSRAGDPHRHLHLQVNARVWAAGGVAGPPLGRGPRHHRGDQRDRARRGRHRPGVPGRPRRARAHPGPRDRRDPRARAVRRGVQRADRADPPQRRPLRGRVATRASRRGARAAAAGGVGPAGLGRGPARQGRPHRRRRAGRAVERTSCASSATATRPDPSC